MQVYGPNMNPYGYGQGGAVPQQGAGQANGQQQEQPADPAQVVLQQYASITGQMPTNAQWQLTTSMLSVGEKQIDQQARMGISYDKQLAQLDSALQRDLQTGQIQPETLLFALVQKQNLTTLIQKGVQRTKQFMQEILQKLNEPDEKPYKPPKQPDLSYMDYIYGDASG